MSEDKPLSFVYHQLDAKVVRAMLVFALGGTAQLKFDEILPAVDKPYLEYLVGKADLLGEMGGARLSFVLVTMLRDLFMNVLEIEPGRAKILVEMVLTMAQNIPFNLDEAKTEGPKRGTMDKQQDQRT